MQPQRSVLSPCNLDSTLHRCAQPRICSEVPRSPEDSVQERIDTWSARLSETMRVTKASSPPEHTISVAVPEKAVAGFWPASSMLAKKGGLHIVNVKVSASWNAGASTPTMRQQDFRSLSAHFRC